MASAVTIHADSKQKFQDLKSGALKGTHWITFKLDEGQKQVVVDMLGGDHEDLCNALPEKECRYAAYLFDYAREDGNLMDKMILIECKGWLQGLERYSTKFKKQPSSTEQIFWKQYFSKGTDLGSSTTYARSPDDARIQSKMMYSSSKAALLRDLVGVQVQVRATGWSEIDTEELNLKVRASDY